jgi:hypothetical protein
MRHSGILLHGWKITGYSEERDLRRLLILSLADLKKVKTPTSGMQSKPMFNEPLTASAVVTRPYPKLPHASRILQHKA